MSSFPLAWSGRSVFIAPDQAITWSNRVCRFCSAASVGMKVQLDHLAPSAVGHRVVAEAVVEKVNGRRVLFTVSVNDDRGLIAVGRVTRVVVDAENFVAKAAGTS